MVQELPLTPEADAQELMTWLDEQRQIERERLTEVARSIEQLRDEVRDHGTALATLTESFAEHADESDAELIAQIGNQVMQIERVIEDHLAATARAEQGQNSQHERELRQFADLSQRVDAINRALDAANGKLGAFGEELRRLRSEQVPIVQAVEEIQRAQISLQDRAQIFDEVMRRYSGFQARVEQSTGKQADDLTRLDDQQKLLDVRLTRDLTEVRQAVEDLTAGTDERFKPVAEILRRLATLTERQELTDQRISGLMHNAESVIAEISRLDAQSKVDRTSLKRLADAVEAQSQRIDEVIASGWQIGERINGLGASIEEGREEMVALIPRISECERQIQRLDDERLRLHEALSDLGLTLHDSQRDARDQSGSALARIDAEIVSLRAQIATVHDLAVERLRRTTRELQQQLRELEPDQS